MTNHPRSEFPDETSAILVSVVEIHGQEDILIARQAGRDAARNIGLGTVDQTRLATVISELARNALRYAGGGQCRITTQVAVLTRTIVLEIEDRGPGIDNVTAALTPGFSTGGGLGLGMSAVLRLMDDMIVETRPGRTMIRAQMVRHT
ncbi:MULTISPECIES: anti-sigma regulatory factor [unclassified Methylobacterium]|uniref:anti-sigma regulatory factor n=1 Tax=unclassified Methylobacterium TaxID=2615210 RepID=UPI0009E9BC23|nr:MULTISPECIES: anti-sigma regulatory factor [unclassified Methylobacterium]